MIGSVPKARYDRLRSSRNPRIRSVDTPEVHEALTLLEPHIQPEWLVQQFRHHALKARGEKLFEREGQQQVLRPSFEGIRDSVRDLLGKQMDALARQFHETHDLK